MRQPEWLDEVRTVLGTMLLGGQPLTEAAWRSLPRFRWTAQARAPVDPVLCLALLSLIVGSVALRRFRRAEPP